MVAMDPDPLQGHPYYKTERYLGDGSFGFVLLAVNTRTNEPYAIKFLRRGSVTKYVDSEIINHNLLRHDHVIEFKEVFLTADYVCIAMEYASGGSLFDYVKQHHKLKEPVARWFFQQLIMAVDYCHRRGVANRDIKLENTLLQNVEGLPLPLLKLCDFGYSKSDHKSAAKSKVGTLTYMAPEVLVNRSGKYDGKLADIWSCGVILYIMLYGVYPFDIPGGSAMPVAREVLQMLDKMVNRKYELPEKIKVSKECLVLLSKLLAPEPSERIKVQDIMLDPWFRINLPADAVTMNDRALSMPFPSEAQNAEAIRQLLEQAKLRGGAVYQAVQDEEVDVDIDTAMDEAAKTGSAEMQDYLSKNQ